VKIEAFAARRTRSPLPWRLHRRRGNLHSYSIARTHARMAAVPLRRGVEDVQPRTTWSLTLPAHPKGTSSRYSGHRTGYPALSRKERGSRIGAFHLNISQFDSVIWLYPTPSIEKGNEAVRQSLHCNEHFRKTGKRLFPTRHSRALSPRSKSIPFDQYLKEEGNR